MSVAWSSGQEPEAEKYVPTVSVPEFDDGRQALHQIPKEGLYPPQNELEAS